MKLFLSRHKLSTTSIKRCLNTMKSYLLYVSFIALFYSQNLTSQTVLINETNVVSNTFTVTSDGIYEITIVGGEGGDGTRTHGGQGATVKTQFNLVANDVIRYLVAEGGFGGSEAGGGGSTGIYINNTLVMVAGGGGGGDNSNNAVGFGANDTENGDNATGGSAPNGGTNGSGGGRYVDANNGGSGGGGINSNGSNGRNSQGGQSAKVDFSLADGGAAGRATSGKGGRGLTGGGGTDGFLGGGGGGYSGGASSGSGGSSGGGGSFVDSSFSKYLTHTITAGADGAATGGTQGNGTNGSVIISTLIDSDGDGVPDVTDIDDDNDGVLDTDEMKALPNVTSTCSTNCNDVSTNRPMIVDYSFETQNFGGTFNNYQSCGWVIDSSGPYETILDHLLGSSWGASDGNQSLELGHLSRGNLYQDVEVVAGETYTVAFDYGSLDGGVVNFEFLVTDESSNTELINENIDTKGNILPGGTFGAAALKRIETFTTTTFTALSNSVRIRFRQISVDNLGTVIDNVRMTGLAPISQVISCTGELDTDNDGIVNRLDLDSDGDNCSDALEAGATTSLTQNFKFNSTIANGDSNKDGLADLIDDNLDGVPDYSVSSNTYTAYALESTINACTDTDSDGVPDITDIDDDNDGILDTVEDSCEVNGTSAAQAFTKLGQARNVTTAGIYFFNLDGNEFSTYVDQNGYVQIALDFGNGAGILPQGTTLTNTTRGILNPTMLASLTDAKTVRISHSGGSLDVTNTNTTLLQKITTNTTLYKGNADNATNDSWVGTGANTINVNASCGSARGNLHENIIHVCGNRSSFIWLPSSSYQRLVWRNGEIPATDSFTLWVQADNSVLNSTCDIDSDGKKNSLDPDSDGDGCSDAFEAGATTNSTVGFTFTSQAGTPTDANSDGLPDAVDAAPGSDGVPDYMSTYNNALDETIKNCLDTDGDGILDAVDVDDDNDGILDVDESCTGNANPNSGTGSNRNEIYIFDWSDAAFADGIQNNDSKTVTLPSGIVVTATFVVDAANTTNAGRMNAVDLSKWGPSRLNQLYNTPSLKDALETANGGDVEFTINFTANLNGVAQEINLLALDGESTNGVNESISFETNGGNWQLLETDTNGPGDWVGEGTNTVTANDTENGTSIFYSTNSTQLTVNLNAGGIQAIAVGLWFDCIVDTDGDGIINSLDLDSDGDGCPDTVEAGIPYTNTDLQTGNLVNGDGTTNTTTATINAILNPNGEDDNNDGLNDSVDTAEDGMPDYTSTYNTAAKDNTINFCTVDLSATKQVNKSVPKVGEEIIFTIVLKNSGPGIASSIQVIDMLPTGLTYVAANSTIPANTTYTSGTGIWDLGNLTLAKDETIELKIAATVDTAGSIILNKTEVFSISQTDIDSNSNSNN